MSHGIVAVLGLRCVGLPLAYDRSASKVRAYQAPAKLMFVDNPDCLGTKATGVNAWRP
jgi:hypothetical protein